MLPCNFLIGHVFLPFNRPENRDMVISTSNKTCGFGIDEGHQDHQITHLA